jgi:hypothetical protein
MSMVGTSAASWRTSARSVSAAVGAHFDKDHTEREAPAFKSETVECDPLCPLDVQADKVEAMDAELLEVVADWATLYAHHRRRDQAARLQIGHARHHL